MQCVSSARWVIASSLFLAACSADRAPEASASPEVSSASPPIPQEQPSAPPAVPFAVPAAFKATGTEPFWSASVLGDTLIYSTPEFPEGARVAISRSNESGLVRLTGTIDGKPLELEVRAGPCSDGMSDVVYPLAVTRKIGTDIQRGCAA